MAFDDEWGHMENPCPICNEIVKYSHFGADCRGNEATGGLSCGCKKPLDSRDPRLGRYYSERRGRWIDA